MRGITGLVTHLKSWREHSSNMRDVLDLSRPRVQRLVERGRWFKILLTLYPGPTYYATTLRFASGLPVAYPYKIGVKVPLFTRLATGCLLGNSHAYWKI